MFGRIMAVVVAVIVLLTSVLSGLGLYTLTSRQTAIRQENLRAEARACIPAAAAPTRSARRCFRAARRIPWRSSTSAGRRRRCTTSTARISRLSTALGR